MTVYYFGGIDPRSNKSFTMIVTAATYAEAKATAIAWLRKRGRDDLAELIAESVNRVLRIVKPNDSIVIFFNDVTLGEIDG